MSEFIIECEYDVDEGWIPGEQREEIVRCRDCKFKDEPWNCAAPYFVEPDGYCAWGRKKDK